MPINAPKSAVNSYNRDGAMRYRNPGDPVYAPNSAGGPKADARYTEPGWEVEAGEIMRSPYVAHSEDNDFVQPRLLWTDVLSETDREHLVTNITNHLKSGVTPEMVARVVEYWRNVHPDLSDRIAQGMGLPTTAGAPAGT